MDENSEFFFESDHLAIRGNADYRAMLRYILILESQKIVLIKDIEKLANEQQKALDDPQQFLEDLKKGEIVFPTTHSIPKIPEVTWADYGMEDFEDTQWKQNMTETEHDNSNNVLIRGRVFDQTKPETFNQLWTCEEQLRLEELLKEYPVEEVETRRWSKIAKALGNRTPKQVMSRVQKYFLKLQRAGLPVPGRSPRVIPNKTTIAHRHNRNNKFLHRRTTFFPAEDVPVFMDELQDEAESSASSRVSEQWSPLELMEAVYERRRIEEMSNADLPVHHGIICIGCSSENIVGTRWTDGEGSDWCSDCLIVFQPTNKLTPVGSLSFKETTDHDN